MTVSLSLSDYLRPLVWARSGACGEGCAATTSAQADIDACAAITLAGTDYTGDVGTDRRVECEGTPAPCQYTPPTTCTAATCCDGATFSPRPPVNFLPLLLHSPPIGPRPRARPPTQLKPHRALCCRHQRLRGQPVYRRGVHVRGRSCTRSRAHVHVRFWLLRFG